MDNWEHEHVTPRPIALGRDLYKSWPFEPAAISGTGADTGYGAFIDLDEPLGPGLHALPGVTLETDKGGLLEAAAEFWDDAEKVGEAILANLSAMETRAPVAYADYTLPDMRAASSTMDGTGVFYSAWSAFSCPACSVALLIPYVAADGMLFSSSVELELGDAGGGVLASIALGTFNQTAGVGAAGTITLSAAREMASLVSIPACAKARCKLTVNSASGSGWPSGSVGGKIRRFS